MDAITVSTPLKLRPPQFYMPEHTLVVQTQMEEPALTAVDHKADPIKSIEDILLIRDYLHGQNRYRDQLLFIMGINFGLRISDLLRLRVGDILTPELEYRLPVVVREGKTGKARKLYVNQAIHEAFSDYIASLGALDLNALLFQGYKGKPMCRRNADYLLRGIMDDLNLPYNCGTHMLRKTFAYWTLKTARDKQRALYYLQKTLNHSSATTTLFYAGITDDEIMETSMNLNLGYRSVLDPEAVFMTCAGGEVDV